jgi:hypothetical protein
MARVTTITYSDEHTRTGVLVWRQFSWMCVAAGCSGTLSAAQQLVSVPMSQHIVKY